MRLFFIIFSIFFLTNCSNKSKDLKSPCASNGNGKCERIPLNTDWVKNYV